MSIWSVLLGGIFFIIGCFIINRGLYNFGMNIANGLINAEKIKQLGELERIKISSIKT